MAGIGFQLHKLIEDESFLKKAKAYIFASIITSGPWILSIICLGLIGVLSGRFISGVRFSIVSITIVYTFAFSLIFTAPVQFILTRYLADKEYLKQRDKMLSALLSAILMNLILSLAIAVPWYSLSAGSIPYKLFSILLFVIICAVWTMMDFLSCSKNYVGIVTAFFIGSVASLVLSPILGTWYGLEGSLAGYTAGQLFIVIMLLYFIVREFPFHGFYNREFMGYFKLFPFILLTGLFYNLGLWIDKLIGWFMFGEKIFGNFKGFNTYDVPVFIAYLIIIPSLAFFLIQSETRFYLAHRRFFDSISHEQLDNILRYKNDLVRVLNDSLLKLFSIQFVSSLIGFLFSDFIGSWFGLSAQSIGILKILFFAAGGQVLFLYVIIFLMYFDLSQISFYLVMLFFGLNCLLNLLFVYYPVVQLGVGYLVSVVFSGVIGLGLLLYSVTDVEYRIFIRQEN